MKPDRVIKAGLSFGARINTKLGMYVSSHSYHLCRSDRASWCNLKAVPDDHIPRLS